jgi:hypothetical protein
MSRGKRHLNRGKGRRMKRNLDEQIVNLDGKQFEPPLTLGGACFGAAAGMVPQDQGIAQDKKFKLYGLAKRAHAGGVQDFSSEEITLLKERIAMMYSTIVTGVAFEMLEKDWVEPANG